MMAFVGGLIFGVLLALAACYAVYDETSHAIEQVVKPGEEIACRNATVLIDARGEISWIDNDQLPEIIRKDKED